MAKPNVMMEMTHKEFMMVATNARSSMDGIVTIQTMILLVIATR